MSEIRANTVSDAAGTGPATLTGQSSAKTMWAVNQAGNVYIGLADASLSNKSLNTSSYTDAAVGRVYVNLTSAFGAEPILVFGAGYTNNTATFDANSTSSQVHVRTNDADSNGAQDNWHACAMFGDLA